MEFHAVSGNRVHTVILANDSEVPAQAARAGSNSRGDGRGGARAEKHRLAEVGDEVGADDLVDTIDVESPGSGEHGPVAERASPEGVTRRVLPNVGLGLDDPNRPDGPTRPHDEDGPEQVPGDSGRGAVEERSTCSGTDAVR
jgi:hypothetical protein